MRFYDAVECNYTGKKFLNCEMNCHYDVMKFK
jgi:hypothetical protein